MGVDNISLISNMYHILYRDSRDFRDSRDSRDVRDYPDEVSHAAEADDYGYDYDDDDDDDGYYDGYQDDGYGELVWSTESRWRPVAAILGVVVALGAVATAVIINSGDSATTKATVGAPVGAPTPRTVVSTTPRTTAPPSTSPSPPPSTSARPSTSAPQLAPETVTTVTIPSAAPTRIPTAAPPQPGTPPSAALSPRAVFYSVTGTKQLLDIVNVVYTDERGFPVTEFNVALPWTKMVVLNPGVQTESVVATSIYSRLNCVIVNAQGQPVVASTTNSILATCTR
ncbi:putative transport accessory protein MmpS3 [Mycobacterium innocens]|uniref:Putative transport accessory protein MmpS3 n=1 Tax=Mycobacterium innocens TaxID=2341083 RepID=A0A498PW38_9MYCO|nr:putative transport accessory protein MmpS3 [Mycobacterium innocens]